MKLIFSVTIDNGNSNALINTLCITIIFCIYRRSWYGNTAAVTVFPKRIRDDLPYTSVRQGSYPLVINRRFLNYIYYIIQVYSVIDVHTYSGPKLKK